MVLLLVFNIQNQSAHVVGIYSKGGIVRLPLEGICWIDDLIDEVGRACFDALYEVRHRKRIGEVDQQMDMIRHHVEGNNLTAVLSTGILNVAIEARFQFWSD